ncbi:MAG: nuclear transport factor 2 family protein [Gemmatimonadota bacterium]|nr:MAG: nuclear transport factor 2 family protein [Gemmatimonadota bacterium]
MLRTAAAITLALVVITPVGSAQSAADSAAIRATALDYIEGWYTGDAARMERALHPDLAKRIVRTDQDGVSSLSHMTAGQLVTATESGYGKQTPVDERQKEVTILDVYRGAAVVKIVARDWIDYLQIGRFDGRWVIINVLWELKAQP